MGFGTWAQGWGESPHLRLVAPVLCVAWEAMMFTRIVFAGADPSLSASGTRLGLLALMAIGCAVLFFRYRLPFVAVLMESVACFAASMMGALSYLYIMPLVALYACVARAPRREAVMGGALGGGAVAASAAVDVFVRSSTGLSAVPLPPAPSLPASLASIGYPLMLVIGAALFSRLRWRHRCELEEEAAREAVRKAELAHAAAERDRALAKNRIAGELHDSVGHDLTAIIALSEGLAGTTGDEQLDYALSSINDLARAGLADTRRAVSALASGELDASDGDDAGEGIAASHRWNEIAALLGPSRASGVAATLIETGRRADDAAQADLAFRICREAVTNTMRHATDLRRLTVSIDHAKGGSVTVSVRDDGIGCPDGDERAHGTGMGLARIRGEVEAADGTLDVGPTVDGGWALCASLPPLKASKGTSNEGEQHD